MLNISLTEKKERKKMAYTYSTFMKRWSNKQYNLEAKVCTQYCTENTTTIEILIYCSSSFRRKGPGFQASFQI
uniref:Uncharacterized protein n=1 Tax=Anguilla anguilla TaxID=7936 RepID=A0A0E9WUF3_ANGAN